MHPHDFGDIRSLVNEPYSVHVWAQVCSWVQEFDGEELHARVLPYVEGSLRRWTDEQRAVPRMWLRRLMEGTDVPWMPVARALIAHRIQHPSYAPWSHPKPALLLSRILGRPELEHLALLDFSYSWLTAKDLTACSETPYLEQLSRLVLRGTTLEDESGWHELFEAKSMPYLTSLDMSACKLDDDAVERLVHAENFGELVELSLWDNYLTRDAVASLSEAPRTQNLHLLDLGRNPLGPRGLEAMGHRELRTLRLDQTRLGDEGAAWLASSGLRRLEELNLWKSNIGDAGVAALAASSSLRSVRGLNLGRNNIGDAGAIALAKSDTFLDLRELNLFGNRITDAGALALASSPNLARLDTFYIHDNQLTARGEVALANSAHLPEHVRAQW